MLSHRSEYPSIVFFGRQYATGIGLQRGTKLTISLILHISVPHFFVRVPF